MPSAATVLNASVAATRASAADVGGRGIRASFTRAGRLHRDVEIGHPVLEGLEAADRPTELLTLPVLSTVRSGSGWRTDLFRRQAVSQRHRHTGTVPSGEVLSGVSRANRRVGSMDGSASALNSVHRSSLPSWAAMTMSATSPLIT